MLIQNDSLKNQFFDEEGLSLPLTRAAWKGHDDIIDILIIFGADVNKKVKNGYTAIFFACERGRTSTLERLLECRNIDIEATNDQGFTALDTAIINGYYNCA